MGGTIPDVSRAARDRQQAQWQAGVDWCDEQRLAKRALAAIPDDDPRARYLFLLGVADSLTAVARDLIGIDVRRGS